MAALMLGIDFSKTDIQISLWNEERSRAELYNFTGASNGEVIPTMIIVNEEGTFLTGREALDYSMRCQKQGITSLYGNFSKETIKIEPYEMTATDLFATYLTSVLGAVRKRFGSAPIAKIGITGERMTTEHAEHLVEVMQKVGYEREQLYFSTHADAFLWYELCESPDTTASMTVDFDSKGVLAYVHTGGNEEKGLPAYVSSYDYSDLTMGSLSNILDLQERAHSFETITRMALARRKIETLYVTGDFVENPEINHILQGLSEEGRRIFAGRGLYSLGACWHAVREKLPKKAIGDRQIFHSVYIEAYKDATEGAVRMLKGGTALEKAESAVQVILDDTTELRFQIEDVRTKSTMTCAFQPDKMWPRENKTIRLEVKVSFLDYETLVLKVRDIGFGEIYPATYRVWEQLIHLS